MRLFLPTAPAFRFSRLPVLLTRLRGGVSTEKEYRPFLKGERAQAHHASRSARAAGPADPTGPRLHPHRDHPTPGRGSLPQLYRLLVAGPQPLQPPAG